MTDAAAATGETAWLHTSKADIKIVHSVTSKSGVYHFDLDQRAEVLAYTSSRGLTRVCGPITSSIVGPASADLVISASASIVPTDVSHWPTNLSEVRADSFAKNFSVSALTPVPTVVLDFHPAINHQLKPRPFLGRHPAFLAGWSIQTTSSTVAVDIEVVVPLEFSGIDWIQPASWA